MYRLDNLGGDGQGVRLVSNQPLRPDDFRELADRIGSGVVRARKIGFVSAREATAREVVETRWNGKEMTATAEPGDIIVANLAPDKTVLIDQDGHANIYVIKAARFSDLYERDTGETSYGAIYRARGVVEAVGLPGGFDIVDPWGTRQVADAGYLLLNGPDVYGNNKETFERTYRVI